MTAEDRDDVLEILAATRSLIDANASTWKSHATTAADINTGRSLYEIAASVAGKLLDAKKVVPGLTKGSIHDSIPLYLGLVEWARSGFPHFSLSDDFFHALAVTDFGDPSEEPLYMPFNAYTVSFPKTAALGFSSRAFVLRLPKFHEDKRVEWNFYRATLMSDPVWFTQWEIGATRKQIFQGHVVESDDDPAASQLLISLRVMIANMLSYIESSGALPTKKSDGTPAAVERVHKTQQNFIVGRSIKLDGATRRALISGAGTAAGWKLMQKFMVRGHWRNQVHGEGRALRRRQWIAPFYKGPENVVDALERTYEVE